MVKFSRKTLVFSTGGYVAVPVVFAAWITRKKIFIHEQTSRAGLANRLCAMCANKVFVSFEESKKFFPKNKTFLSGYPLRDECYTSEIANVQLGNRMISPSELKKPLLFITGGGNGSLLLNQVVKENLTWFKENFFIVHQVGKNFLSEFSAYNDESYVAIDFIGEGMIDLYKMATIIISRAGAGTVCELMALGKKSIYVPLKIAQKNEQYFNALEASRKNSSMIILEDEIKAADWKKIINDFLKSGTSRVIPLKELRPKNFLISQIEESQNASV